MIDYQFLNNDIVMQQGDLTFVSDGKAVRQRLEQKLRLWRGEWFLDLNAGVPWLQSILGKRPRPTVVAGIIRQLIESDPQVLSVENITIDYDDDKRKLNIRFTTKLTEDANETSSRLQNVEIAV